MSPTAHEVIMHIYTVRDWNLPVVSLAVLVVPDPVAVVIEELAVLGGPANLHHPAGHNQHLVVPTA